MMSAWDCFLNYKQDFCIYRGVYYISHQLYRLSSRPPEQNTRPNPDSKMHQQDVHVFDVLALATLRFLGRESLSAAVGH